MANRLNVYAEKLTRIHEAIVFLEDGGPSAILDGVAYLPTQLPDLYTLRDLIAVRAAIQAIEEGMQEYSVLGRVYRRGDLQVLYDREKALEVRATRKARGGTIRTRLAVPLG